jgi:cytidyltransferase-like protein
MIVTIDQLADIRAQHHGQKVILTSGTFDLFHVGHLRYLQAVKAYGDLVVVMLSGDTRIKLRKGPERPIIPEDDRAQILDALSIVDHVFIDPGDSSLDHVDPIYATLLANLQPDAYVTDGEDVRVTSSLDRSKCIILPRVEDGAAHASTSAIIAHIAALPSSGG